MLGEEVFSQELIKVIIYSKKGGIFMIGKLLNQRYQVIDKLGKGGMATVYLAEDQVLERKVAVKIPFLKPDQPSVQRFISEAKTLAKMSHQNIVNIYDAGTDQNIHYMVMDYVDGISMDRLIKNGKPMPVVDVLNIMFQICLGLAYAHEKGIIHRDIKPSNLLVNNSGEIKISDFGTARRIESETALTQTGELIGTVFYFSPEQAQNKVITPKSDIYSLGIVLYELLTAARPFIATDFVAVAMMHILEPIPDPRQIIPDVPASLYNVLRKATEKNPEQRYQDIMDMYKDLQLVLPSRERSADFSKPHNTITNTNEDIHTNNELSIREAAATATGDAKTMFQLGRDLLVGENLEQDVQKGERFLRAAAKAGYTEAIYLLGWALIEGEHFAQNIDEGEKFLRFAAKTYPEAMFQLGKYLIEGDYLKQNLDQGEQYLRKALKAGETQAASYLANQLIEGKHLQQDVQKGAQLLRTAAKTDSYVMFQLGSDLIEGNNLTQDLDEGEQLLRTAAKEVPYAMYKLGIYLLEGKHLKQDVLEGELCLRAAAKTDSFSMYKLGRYLIQGEYLKQDIQEGHLWLQDAAKSDTLYAYFLGRDLIEGSWYIKQNVVEGEQWLRKAANESNTYAMLQLGQYLIKGEHLKKDVAEGERWIRASVQAGDNEAMFHLGKYLVEGNYLQQNKTKGEHWLRASATRNNNEAMYYLGIFLIEGVYLEQDIKEGKQLILDAAKRGNKQATKYLQRDEKPDDTSDHNEVTNNTTEESYDAYDTFLGLLFWLGLLGFIIYILAKNQ
jgi:serine/threonine-protein kinase